MKSPRVIQDSSTFFSSFQSLEKGDVVCGRIPMRLQEEHLLLDLSARGVHLIPSASAQMASRSKTYQARIFSPWMVPLTSSIYSSHHLLETVNQYQEQGITKVVVKHDRKNAGLGILLYNSIEDAYTHAANNVLAFPFVIQPFIANSKDIRVIIIGSYIEAYERSNPNSFRNNLHCGGTAIPYTLSEENLAFCKEVLRRGGFPYGHLDLMMAEEGKTYLAEINLRGGLRGAKITTTDYKEKVAALEQTLLCDMQR